MFTFTPENSVPQKFIDDLFAEVAAAGGELIPVELTSSEAEIERRLAHDSRVQPGKLTDLALYRRLRDASAFRTPVIPSSRLRLDTGARPPAEAVREIVARLG